MKREIVDYEVRGFKSDDDGNTKSVVRKIIAEVNVDEDADETTFFLEEDYYCVTIECTDGEVIVEKSGQYVFNKDIVNDIVADQRKVDKNAVVKVHTLKKFRFYNYYYDKDEKMIFNNYFNIHIANVENIPSNIDEIISKLTLVSNVYGSIWIDDINEIYKIDEMIEENFIIEEEISY